MKQKQRTKPWLTGKKTQYKPDLSTKGIDTQLSHLGRDSHNFHGFVNPPVVRASTVLFDSVEAMEARGEDSPLKPKYTYGLNGTPTIDALVDTINALEEAAGTVLVPSGLAAVTVPLLAVARPGLQLLVPDNVYWPTRRFCDQTLKQLGVETVYYDPLIGFRHRRPHAPRWRHRFVHRGAGVEYVRDARSQRFLGGGQNADAITMIDNTWATPLIYKPVPEGFDYSIQAGTKYFAGHSDLLIGSISASERGWPALARTRENLGVQAGTEEIFLTLRGMRSLRVRLDQHEKSALKVAEWLDGQPFVTKVMHPALPSDPGHQLWLDLFKGRASGLFGFELNGSRDQGRAMLNALELFGLGYSWGGYESLAVLAELDHCRTSRPWSGGPVIRLQIGLETVNDLKADLLAAANAAGLPTS
jgi:cystathionine beta-lyase